jgi:hypothetical protein
MGCEGPGGAGGDLPGSAMGAATALTPFLACGLGLGLAFALDGTVDPAAEVTDAGADEVGDDGDTAVVIFSGPAAASFSTFGVRAGLALPLAVALVTELRLFSPAVVDVELRLLLCLAASSSSGNNDVKTS